MKAKKDIYIAIETIDDLGYNNLADEYFEILKKLILNGHELKIHRRGNNYINTVKDIAHLDKLKKALNYPFKSAGLE
jgi:hypothetical protein